MKTYEMAGHIVQDDSDAFLTLVSRRIEEYQSKGLTVEITYQPFLNGFSALILGYREAK
jgi:hypothetical protein